MPKVDVDLQRTILFSVIAVVIGGLVYSGHLPVSAFTSFLMVLVPSPVLIDRKEDDK
jgi:hypothetical protein